jgi:hypothetical protein
MINAAVHNQHKQPWLNSLQLDGLFILSPPFIALLIVSLFPERFKNSAAMPLIYWVVLIVMVDVAHVYSTLYRTYFRPLALKQQPVLVIIPLICYVCGIALYAIDGMIFWRVLAYLAVFHFIRQQYGFLRLYSRKEQHGTLITYIDTITIYTATIYPLAYWHLTTGRKFNWFIDGDFVLFQIPHALQLSTAIYLLVILIYVIKETWLIIKNREINIPRNLLVLGTLLSWYFGIVYFNGDMAFTTLNVVSHGIPYMALIWIVERRQFNKQIAGENSIRRLTFNTSIGILIFVGLLILLAYLEEGLWDGFVWREHPGFFSLFKNLPLIKDNVALVLLVPLLALPQSTHYVLDGFIWKMKKTKEF